MPQLNLKFHHPGWFLLIMSALTFLVTIYLAVVQSWILFPLFLALSLCHIGILLGNRAGAQVLACLYILGAIVFVIQIAMFLTGQPFTWRPIQKLAFNLAVLHSLYEWLQAHPKVE